MDSLIDALVDCRCLVCGQPSNFRQAICNHCLVAMTTPASSCTICSLPLPAGLHEQACGHCLAEPPPYQQLLTIGPYQGALSRLISRFKYQGDRVSGRALCDAWLQLNLARLEEKPQLLISVPLALKRRVLRGFNQSVFISQQLSQSLKIPYSPKVFRRRGDSQQMVELNRKQRFSAVRQQYSLIQPPTAGYLILVDDVVTTGATVNALARLLLRQNPGLKIDIWCLARTP